MGKKGKGKKALSRNEDISQAVDKAMTRKSEKKADKPGSGKGSGKGGNKKKDGKKGDKKKDGKGDKYGMGSRRNKRAMKRETEVSKAADAKTIEAIDKTKTGELDLSQAPELKTTDANIDTTTLRDMPNVNTGVLDRGKFEQSAYDSLTRNYDRDKMRELELQKQDLADRGIPYDPGDTSSAYGRALQGINESWDSKKKDAAKQAFTMADAAQLTQSNIGQTAFTQGLDVRKQDVGEQQTVVENTMANTTANNAARGQFVEEALTQNRLPYEQATAAAGLSKDSDIISQIMTKYGIDKDAATKMAIADKQKEAAIEAAKISSAARGGEEEEGGDRFNP